jgi:5-methylcytosine-specific restriction endonuclease McrA
MTTEKAIEFGKIFLKTIADEKGSATYEFVEMAINALEQEPCEDVISREQAKSAIRDRFKDLPSRVEINTILNELPSVTPQPKTGHWQKISADKYSEHVAYYFRCSECGKDIIGEHNYCPNCGCRMVESEDKV